MLDSKDIKAALKKRFPRYSFSVRKSGPSRYTMRASCLEPGKLSDQAKAELDSYFKHILEHPQDFVRVRGISASGWQCEPRQG